MKILYFHGFGASLNGRKATCLKTHFGPDAVIEPPDPGFPYCSTLTKPLLKKLSQRLRNEPTALLALLGPNRCAAMNRLSPEIADFFRRSVKIAQELCDKIRPDIIVGSSLGGSVAMTIDSGQTPMLLIDPVWNRDLKPGLYADNMPIPGPMAKALISLAIATFRNPIAQLAGFEVPRSIKPQTIILHSPHDRLFDLANSHALLRNSPIAAYDLCRKCMDRVTDHLTAVGYANQKSDDETRFNDGRLIIIGKDHHNNETDPNDRRNRDPHPHNALVAVIRLLHQEFGSWN